MFFFVVSKIAEIFISPINAGLILAASGVALLFTRFAKTGRVLAAAAVGALLVIAVSPLADALMAPLENRFPAPPADAPAPDGVIILGGAVDEHITASRGRAAVNDAAERLFALVELARLYPRARIVFTGGTAALTGSRQTEAHAVRLLMREIGFDPDRVIYEDRSRNTWENAVNTRELVDAAARRALAARHLGGAYAALDRHISARRLRRHRLSGRLSNDRRRADLTALSQARARIRWRCSMSPRTSGSASSPIV